jgi:hypothetical protein
MHFHGGGTLAGAELPAELAGVDWAYAVFHCAVWARVPADRDPAGRSGWVSPCLSTGRSSQPSGCGSASPR